MGKIKHVALFDRRHYFPSYVQDSVFISTKDGYSPTDQETFDEVALTSCMRWKSEGYTGIYVYLSGLTIPTVCLIKVAYKLCLDLRLYYFSFIQNEWLPQDLPWGSSYEKGISSRELDLLRKEKNLRYVYTKSENQELVSYARILLDLKQKVRDSGVFNWDTERNQILSTYSNLKTEYVELMRPYVDPNMEAPKEWYCDELGERLIKRRGLQQQPKQNGPKPKFKGSTYKRKHRHSYK